MTKNRNLKLKIFLLNILIALVALGGFAMAGTLIPASAPGRTMHTLDDIYCKITGCTPGTYSLNTSAMPAATMHALSEINTATAMLSHFQKNQIWDDNALTSSSTAGSLSYAYANVVDQNVEESVWSSTTDTTLSGATVASGLVKKDTRTGLYWTDCYGTSGSGSCSTRTNSFTLNGIISDTNDGLDAEGGNAVDFCEALSLDSDGNGTNETDWYLPSQKELIQAYIDGASNNIPHISGNYYWSSTEYSGLASYAWYVYLYYGYTFNFTKSSGYYARCARR